MATPFPFVAGAVLTAANLNSITELVTNTQTNDYTLAATDAGDRVIANKATAIVFTVPNSVFSAAQIVRIHNIGAGTLTISAGAGLTLNGADVLTLAQYQGGELFFTSASSAIFFPTAKTVSAGGLVLISSTTIGSAQSSVTVSSAFSSTYDNYLILLHGGTTTSTNAYLFLTLGATTSGYNQGGYSSTYPSSNLGSERRSNTTSWYGGYMNTGGVNGMITLLGPNLAKNTIVKSTFASTRTADAGYELPGFLNDTTQYTAFTLTTESGTVTGGTIRVYGYANS